MNKRFYIVLLGLVMATSLASASNLRTNFTTAVWTDMQDIPEVIAMSKSGRKTDLEVCFFAGKYSADIQSRSNQLLTREFPSLENDLGSDGYFNVLRMQLQLNNLVTGVSDRCQSKLDRSALITDLTLIYRGYLSVYRILDPSDVGRAINNITESKILSSSEKTQVLEPITNTSELRDLNPSQLK